MSTRNAIRPSIVAPALALVLGLAGSPTAQADTFGFAFQLGNSATSNVTGNGYGGVRFTAIESMTIDRLSLGLTSGSGTVAFALQADDGFGDPTGLDLAVGAVTAGAGFKSADITPTSINAGSTYHIVARASAGASAGLRALTTGTVAGVNTRDGSAAPNTAQMTSSNAGSTWTDTSFANRALVWGVSNSETHQAQGQPYNGGVTANFGANIYRGQSFTQNTGEDVKVNSLTVSLIRNANTETSAGDVMIRLLEKGTLNEVYSALLVTPSQVAVGDSGFFTANIAEANRPTLIDGEDYILAVTSRSSTSTTAWRLVASGVDPNAGDVIKENFQGSGGYQALGVLNSSGVATSFDIEGATPTDAYFLLGVTAVPEPGSLVLMGLGVLALARRRR